MARIRTIKPEFWKHEDLSELPEATHMLAAALLNHADDEGYFNANPALIRAECCPLREPSVSVHDSLIALVKIGYLQLGSGTDGKRYGRIVTFDEHQRVNRPTASKIKGLVDAWEDSLRTHTQLTEGSPPERKGKERKGKEGNAEPGADAPPPPKSRKRQEQTFAQWVESLGDADTIPADDPVFAYADRVGLPREFVAVEWGWFEAKYSAGSGKAKRYADWRQTFRNAVEGAWGKLWAVNRQGEFYLTTEGVQAQRGLA